MEGGREKTTREDWTSLEGGASTRNPRDGERKARTPVKVTIGLIQVPSDVGSDISGYWYLRRTRRSFTEAAAAASASAVTGQVDSRQREGVGDKTMDDWSGGRV